MTDPTANTPCASEPDCPYCPDGHTPPTGGSQPWSAWVSADRDGDGQPTTINVARSAGAHVAESDAQWVRHRLNAPAAVGRQLAADAADQTAATPTPALTNEGQLRMRVQVLEEDLERSKGLAKVGARCMREGHQGLIESGRSTIEGHRFALAVKLGLGTGAPWDAIHERVAELRRLADETATIQPEARHMLTRMRADSSDNPEHVDDCPGCKAIADDA